jgi:hypothetical protein
MTDYRQNAFMAGLAYFLGIRENGSQHYSGWKTENPETSMGYDYKE